VQAQARAGETTREAKRGWQHARGKARQRATRGGDVTGTGVGWHSPVRALRSVARRHRQQCRGRQPSQRLVAQCQASTGKAVQVQTRAVGSRRSVKPPWRHEGGKPGSE
jgi:hypothetical protein